MKKNLCVVTGARSEYALLRPLIAAIKKEHNFNLQLVASAMHLSPEFGFTVNEIREDGFIIDETVEMLLSSDSAVGVTKSMGVGLISFADVFQRLKPDLIVLLGDRSETWVAAQAALIANIPIAHIHGGELSLGVYDESIRHSITKMSHLHFTASSGYKNRVIQLGEDPNHVFAVGPMIASAIKQYTFLERDALERELDFKLGHPQFLVTLLPETLHRECVSDRANELFSALESVDANIVFTKGNADTFGRELNGLIDDFCQRHSHRAKAFIHLGQHRYLSLMKQSNVVIGNSSSGIIEAPFLRIPTVNIGQRQEGRERHASIIDCDGSKSAIEWAIKKALSNEHVAMTQEMKILGEDKSPVESILETLNRFNFSKLVHKRFYDVEFSYE